MKIKKNGFYLNMTKEERQIIDELKSKYCINISKLIKSLLAEYHKNLRIDK